VTLPQRFLNPLFVDVLGFCHVMAGLVTQVGFTRFGLLAFTEVGQARLPMPSTTFSYAKARMPGTTRPGMTP
jgi:hypothetical protein